MNIQTNSKIIIETVKSSRINEIDFNNLSFGDVFTDHMFECNYENGQWQSPKIKPYGPLLFPPSAKVFHYGQAIFEGMKAFKDDNGGVWLFRPEDNFNRINKSAIRMAIPEFPKDYFFDGLITLLKLDKAWIKSGLGNSLYIRPFIIATEPGISASPSNTYKFMFLLSPAQAYYTGKVKVKFAEQYSRAASGGVGYVKAAGNYGAQFHPTNQAKAEGFDQIIWTDASTHNFLEEAGTMNIFFRIDNKLITAPKSDRILDGITRKSIITIAEDQNITVEIRKVSVAEIVEASNNGSLKEIFGTGTAAIVTPISSFGYQENIYTLPELENTYAASFKKQLMQIQYNLCEDKYGWRYEVE
ncbi:MAG: branched-chain amino acid aminotransferase [Flavobacteriaceae bacterium]|nr:branched-chain amino acid aminotransferase [Flavobacteriaceae bacterium]